MEAESWTQVRDFIIPSLGGLEEETGAALWELGPGFASP